MSVKLKKIKVEKPDNVDAEPLHWRLPHFSVTEDQMPEVKSWEVGNKYRMIVEVEQTEKSDREGDPVRGEFRLVAYKPLPNKSLDEMTDDEFAELQGEMLSGSV